MDRGPIITQFEHALRVVKHLRNLLLLSIASHTCLRMANLPQVFASRRLREYVWQTQPLPFFDSRMGAARLAICRLFL